MKISFEFDLEKPEDQAAYGRILTQNTPIMANPLPESRRRTDGKSWSGPGTFGSYETLDGGGNRVRIVEPTDKPPESLQIHSGIPEDTEFKTKMKYEGFNRREDKGVTVYTSEGNEQAALDSLKDVIAEGQEVEEVVVDKKPEMTLDLSKKKVTDEGTEFTIDVEFKEPIPMEEDHAEVISIQREAHATGKTATEVLASRLAKKHGNCVDLDAPDPEPEKAETAKKAKKDKPPEEIKKAVKKVAAKKKADKSEAGKRIRKLMLDACKLPDIDIAAVNEALFAACDVTALKDIKPDQAETALASINALMDSKAAKAVDTDAPV